MGPGDGARLTVWTQRPKPETAAPHISRVARCGVTPSATAAVVRKLNFGAAPGNAGRCRTPPANGRDSCPAIWAGPPLSLCCAAYLPSLPAARAGRRMPALPYRGAAAGPARWRGRARARRASSVFLLVAARCTLHAALRASSTVSSTSPAAAASTKSAASRPPRPSWRPGLSSSLASTCSPAHVRSRSRCGPAEPQPTLINPAAWAA